MPASVTDPKGREVVLTDDRWSHIISGHPELFGEQAAVLLAVSAPSRQLPGRRPDEEWYYLENAGPSRWLKVVVAYAAGRGRIITAFGRRSMP